MDRKALEMIGKHHMIQQGGSVVVGLSGGADSVALLDFLCSLREAWALTVCACHINHRLRGAESERDEAFARRICAEKGVKIYTFTEEIAAISALSGQGIEEAARERRYARFEQVAQGLGPGTRVATAHTLSDSMETALFHFARGTAMRGLCGIPPVRGRIIRPLIGVTRAEVEAYCARRGLCYVTDSTNFSCDYSRNRIRRRIVPELYRINPAAGEAFSRLSGVLRETDDYMDRQARALLEEIRVPQGVSARGLCGAHPALGHAAVALLLRESGVQVTYARVSRILAAAACGRKEVLALGGGWFARVEGGALGVAQSPRVAGPLADIAVLRGAGTAAIGGRKVAIRCEKYEHYKKIENNAESLLKNMVDYDKIGADTIVRTRRAGDRFSMPGRNWTKTLKKLFNEYGVGAEERGRRIVCADGEGPFWVEGFGPDQRAAPSDTTTRALVITISEEST